MHTAEYVIQPNSIYFRFTFLVEEQIDWLIVSFDYHQARTWQEMNLRDPNGILRFMHLDVNTERFAVVHRDPSLTSDLAIPGEIAPGEWSVEFLRGDKVPERFTLHFEYGCGELPQGIRTSPTERMCWSDGTAQGDFSLNQYDWRKCFREEKRWYKGDLHSHTTLSDGKMTPQGQMEQARAVGLDFVMTTEHNVLPSSWPASEILVIPGMEFTSYGRGDWNALGLRQWIDGWGTGLEDGGMATTEGQIRLLQEAGRLGAIRNINHPMAVNLPWRHPDLPLSCVDTIEIWNNPTWTKANQATEQMLKLWSVLWNDGFRIPGLGGSDNHALPGEFGEDGSPATIGTPTCFVLAERLTAEEIISNIRAGAPSYCDINLNI